MFTQPVCWSRKFFNHCITSSTLKSEGSLPIDGGHIARGENIFLVLVYPNVPIHQCSLIICLPKLLCSFRNFVQKWSGAMDLIPFPAMGIEFISKLIPNNIFSRNWFDVLAMVCATLLSKDFSCGKMKRFMPLSSSSTN